MMLRDLERSQLRPKTFEAYR